MKLGVYADLVYRRDPAGGLSTDRAFVLFVAALAPRVDELVLFGRLHPEPGRTHYSLPRDGVRFVALPHYGRVTELLGVLRSLRGARRAFLRELRDLDAVWLFGPYPVSLVFAVMALRRRKRVFLGVRQDFPEYIRNRLPSPAWGWAVGVAWAFEWVFRLLARRVPTVVVGEVLGRKYGAGRAPVLPVGFSLINDADVVSREDALARPWNGRVVTVGRIDAEKNPLLLPEILRRLRERDERWHFVTVGQGPLEEELAGRARELGLADAFEMRGYVQNGPELWELYRGASAFLHVSLTEGLPQVLFEAAAAGTPIVATDVGGVSAALGGGARGVLVPPGDADAAASALERLRDDQELRRRLLSAGLEHVRGQTLEAQLDRITRFFGL